jgi:CTP synthase
MKTKFIFITGGVVSGLGKGITAASIGLLLKQSGLSVDIIKFDPYLNLDPGTMSPFEHGEVYVLADGTETDLDLGHYERFLNINLTSYSSVSSGKIYAKLLDRERRGEFLGKNVQIIPHVSNFIKAAMIKRVETDVRIIEIGGTTGDIEGEIFLESMRQMQLDFPNQFYHIHLGYIPFLNCSGEYKSKPLQLSLRELQRSGIKPNMIILRSEEIKDRIIPKSIYEKVALFSNLKSENVVSIPDQKSIYDIPPLINQSTLLKSLSSYLNIKNTHPDLPAFFDISTKLSKQEIDNTVFLKIGLITKYTSLEDAYLSVIESIKIAGVYQGVNVKVSLIDSESDHLETLIKQLDGVIIPGGFGNRGLEGKILSCKIARENKIPFLGICLGMQMAVIDFARNVAHIENVYSREQEDKSLKVFSEGNLTNINFVIDYMEAQLLQDYMGGTMRLGDFDCELKKDSLLNKLYNSELVTERHRHRLEVQNSYIDKLEEKGMKFTGKHYFTKDKSKYVVEMIELDQGIHPYFVATQSHPEFLSRLTNPHPLFRGLIKAAIARK